MAKRKLPRSYASLKRELDRVFSLWVRRRDSDDSGTATCCCCGARDDSKSFHAAHFVSRVHLSTRFEPKNVHAACVRCNIFLKGNLAEYAYFLLDKYGPGIIAELRALKHKAVKFSSADLREMIQDYKSKLDAFPKYA